MTTFEQCCQRFCADKAKTIGPNKYSGHHFTQHYDQIFAPRQNDAIKLLEIGVASGASILAWLNYFPKAKVFGIDNEKGFPETHTRFERIKEVGGDDWINRVSLINMSQSDPIALEKLAALGPFDIIVDDGSHKASDIMISMNHLFNAVPAGGIYVVEDTVAPRYDTFMMRTPEDFVKARSLWYMDDHYSCYPPIEYASQRLDEVDYVQMFPSEIDDHHLRGSGQCIIFIQKK